MLQRLLLLFDSPVAWLIWCLYLRFERRFLANRASVLPLDDRGKLEAVARLARAVAEQASTAINGGIWPHQVNPNRPVRFSALPRRPSGSSTLDVTVATCQTP